MVQAPERVRQQAKVGVSAELGFMRHFQRNQVYRGGKDVAGDADRGHWSR